MGATCNGRCMWVLREVSSSSSRRWRRAALLVSHHHHLHSSLRVKVCACAADAPDSQPVERRLWLPGLDPPAHLNGTLPGDFGFDPLELGKEPEALQWYVHAELIHARFAMAGVAGILFTDVLRMFGLKDLPVWYEAGATQFDFADTRTLFFVQLILMGFAETKRYMDIVAPHSQGKEDSFLGLEPALRGLDPGYPGGPFFNPSGLAVDRAELSIMKEKEIKNGRLAMVAMVGFFVQASVTKVGPTENLLTHLSDPWHQTIIQTLTNHH
ncbi:hypothetical protein GOP47_0016742 [Adiantum capillus-veneris]|uniref:Chlorophyll a-b binding protein, chloroplastic n=1 Tax=Adiantum capillus-veneris TaxID=13818 RepID=A0A9D4UIX3_ADICA|nr:hypothetical protein GOP47_0016742 [Adiantum capillus-veneris]